MLRGSGHPPEGRVASTTGAHLCGETHPSLEGHPQSQAFMVETHGTQKKEKS